MSPEMDTQPAPDEKPTPDRRDFRTWIMFAGVFVAAIAITVLVATRNNQGTAGTAEFPDLGDIAAADPNLPSNAEPAPTFALPTMDGSSFDLAGHINNDGRPVVLNLWASWCGPCRSEMPAIDAVSQQRSEIAFVGVAIKDTPDNARAFAEEIGVTYTVAFDDGTVDDAYPVLGLPATFFISGDGTLVKTHFGEVTVDSLNDELNQLFGS